MSLVHELIKELVGDNPVTAVYGGGFKPPTKGHLEVVQKTLSEFPEIDKFIIYVGSGERNGITQAESLLIWDIYKNYLPEKVEIQPSKAPIGDILRYAKNNPEEIVYFIVGARAGNEDDIKDIALRTTGVEDKYPNLKVKTIETLDAGISGTKAREASKKSPEAFYQYLPSNLTDDEKYEIFSYIEDVVKEQLNENASYSKDIDIIEKCAQLTNYMRDKGYNIDPVPAVEFVNGDTENAKDFFGKTAYYDPNEQKIVLYTEGRHPKDIVRSFAHEMIHHIQNLEDRLGPITTQNTQEDDHLNDIEAEANLKGTMTFRNWTDSLNEAIVGDKIECDGCGWSWKIIDGGDDLFMCHKCGHDNTPLNEDGKKTSEKNMDDYKKDNNPKGVKDPFGINAYARELAKGLEEALTIGDKEVERIDKPTNNPEDAIVIYKDGTTEPYLDTLNEGRYDTLVNKLSSIAFEAFKDIHDRGDKEGEFEFRVDHPDDEHDIPSKEFYFDLAGKVVITDDEYEVNGGANAGFDKQGNEITPLLSVQFKIPKNPDWQRVSMDIKDVVRHELEHLTQDGENVKPGKQMDDDQTIRDLIDLDLLPKADYFRLPKEIDSMLQGLYFKAKKSKKPYIDVINDYLDTQPINAEERENILKIWRNRAKALSLPVFESKYKLGKVMREQEEEQTTEQQYQIYCDMDGVLTDFDTQFKELSGGVAPSDYEAKNGKEAFWSLIAQGGVGYWVGMPWMPNGKQLWEYISKYNPIILSAPSRENESRLGKRLWVRNNLSPKPKLILASAANKPNYSTRNKILIDDRADTISNWNAKGGIGILFKSTAQVIEELKKLGL
jgi:hypothetical protein